MNRQMRNHNQTRKQAQIISGAIFVAFCLVVLALAQIGGCVASLENTAYQALHATGTTYDGMMQAAGDAYENGTIDEAKKDEIITVAEKYRSAHLAAVSALEAYKQTKDTTNKEKLTTALTEFGRFNGELTAIITPYILTKE